MAALLLPTFFLALFSFFNLFGIRAGYAYDQLFNCIAGLIAFIVIRKIGRNFFQANSKFFYWVFLAILIVTYIIGLEAKGSKRWIDLYFFNFQASEFFKVFFIVFMADRFSRLAEGVPDIGYFVKTLLYFAVPAFIIFKQPDLGTAMVYVFIFLVMVQFSKIPKRYLLYSGILSVMSFPVLWIFMKEYQRTRILSFVNPHLDQQGTAYNMIQAIITIGSGKLFGRGLGLGTQSKLYFLPENNTDFAFSSLIEQFGFFGGLLVIFLFISLCYTLARKAISTFYNRGEQGGFDFFYTLGFTAFLVVQVFVNMGMNMGIFPIAGITLPLISYGGSAVVTWMIGLALLP